MQTLMAMNYLCPHCDTEFRKPLMLKMRISRRRYACCPYCRGILT